MTARNQIFTVFIFLVVGILVYYPSFYVPFYLDDYDSITNNNFLRSATWLEIFNQYSFRQIPYLSLKANYTLHGLEPLGYHVVNFGLHLLVSLGVFLLAKSLMSTAKVLNPEAIIKWAAVAGILYLVLPLNSQGVTYIIQRIALFAALFYVYALWAYIHFRNSTKSSHKVLFGLIFLSACLLGLMSKQNFVTLPITLLLLELLLFKSIPYELAKKFGVTALLVLFLAHMADFVSGSNIVLSIDRLTRETLEISRWEYFSHQLPTLWMYILKFFVPYPLLLEYSTQIYTWADWQVWTAFFAFLLLIALLIHFNKQKLVIFLILAYFVAHSIESSFIPITDLVFEHRTYLPNVFLTILVALLLARVFRTSEKMKFAVVVASLSIYGYLTFERNSLWQDPMEFYRQNMAHVGDNSRVYSGVAVEFALQKNFLQADHWFQIAIQVGEETRRLSSGTVLAYIEMLQNVGETAKARHLGAMLMNKMWQPAIKAQISSTLAIPYVVEGKCDFAMGLINKALSFEPNNQRALHLKKICEAS